MSELNRQVTSISVVLQGEPETLAGHYFRDASRHALLAEKGERILSRRFGLDRPEPDTLQVISDGMGISRERVDKILLNKERFGVRIQAANKNHPATTACAITAMLVRTRRNF